MAFVEVTKKDHIAVVTMNRPEGAQRPEQGRFHGPGGCPGRRGKGR